MEFDSASQKMKCPFCDTLIGVEEYESVLEEQEKEGWIREEQEKESWTRKEQEKEDWTGEEQEKEGWTREEKDGMGIYVCESCGGEISADKNTGATTCPFCGNHVVFKGQFEDQLRPDYIIPFKLDKKAAKEAYRQHVTSKSFVPSLFLRDNHIDEIVGIYVPFWIYDIDLTGQVSYTAEQIRVWRVKDMEFTEHNTYQIQRGGDLRFEKIPEDGSRKMADDLMESLEPFDFDQAVPFQTAYMAGYVADRYDVDAEECLERAKNRVITSTEAAFRETISGYELVTQSASNLSIRSEEHKYALYPVWVLNTSWQGKKYVFAMNGQTGKIVGDIPADWKAFWKYVVTRGAVFGAVIYLALWLLSYL